MQNKHYEQAIQIYNTALSAGDASLTQQLRRRILDRANELRDGNYDYDASRLLKLFLDIEYRDVEALRLLAAIYHHKKDYQAAINTLYDAKAYAYRPETLQRINARLRGIVSEYTALLQSYDDNRTLLELYQAITQREPDYSPYFITLAKVQMAVNDYEGARQSLSLVVYDPMVSVQARRLLNALHEGASPGNEPTTTIPLTRAGDHFLVDAQLNGVTNIRLLIDTGASLTIVDPSALDKAGINYFNTGRLEWFSTANGRVQAPILILDTLSLGDQTVHALEIGGMEIAPTHGIDGLLGMNYLKHFRFFIDQSESVLRLSPQRVKSVY